MFLAAFGVDMPQGQASDMWPRAAAAFVRLDQSGTREATLGMFGLVPHWAHRVDQRLSTMNARAETIATKPSYREAWRQGRRCIIPAEWIYEPDWRSGRSVSTRIWRTDGQPMGIAGIWDATHMADGSILRSFSMVTVNADDSPMFRQFHAPTKEKRQVVILPESAYTAWLAEPVEQATQLLVGYPSEALACAPETRP